MEYNGRFLKSAVENKSASTRQTKQQNIEAIFQRCEVPNFYYMMNTGDAWFIGIVLHFNKIKNIAKTTAACCLQAVAVSAILVNARS